MANRLCRAYHMSKNNTKTIGISVTIATIAAIGAVMVFATLFTEPHLYMLRQIVPEGILLEQETLLQAVAQQSQSSSSMQSPARICCQYEWPHNYSKDRSIGY